jgi:hypothetical protein
MLAGLPIDYRMPEGDASHGSSSSASVSEMGEDDNNDDDNGEDTENAAPADTVESPALVSVHPSGPSRASRATRGARWGGDACGTCAARGSGRCHPWQPEGFQFPAPDAYDKDKAEWVVICRDVGESKAAETSISACMRCLEG